MQELKESALESFLDAEIPDFEGVWANGKTVEECRKELIEVLEDWLLLKLRDKDHVLVVKGPEINIKQQNSW